MISHSIPIYHRQAPLEIVTPEQTGPKVDFPPKNPQASSAISVTFRHDRLAQLSTDGNGFEMNVADSSSPMNPTDAISLL